jgi:hypothetical protein
MVPWSTLAAQVLSVADDELGNYRTMQQVAAASERIAGAEPRNRWSPSQVLCRPHVSRESRFRNPDAKRMYLGVQVANWGNHPERLGSDGQRAPVGS